MKKSCIPWATFPGSWNRREGRPAEKAILTSRLIDRPLRPLFPKGMRHDVSVVATVMSVDQDNIPDIPAMIGASAALAISEIPWAGPIGAVNIGYVDGEYVVNPTVAQRDVSLMNLTVAGTSEAVLMVEAGAKEVSEEVMLGGILFAHEEIKKIVAFIRRHRRRNRQAQEGVPAAAAGRRREGRRARIRATTRLHGCSKPSTAASATRARSRSRPRSPSTSPSSSRAARSRSATRCTPSQKEVMRRHIIDKGVRPDGRKLTEVRPIWCEVGVLPRPHGSGVFTRGQTQVMTVATLAPMSEKQIIDGIGTEDQQALYAPLQLPRLFHRRSQARAQPGPPRDRSRRAG